MKFIFIFSSKLKYYYCFIFIKFMDAYGCICEYPHIELKIFIKNKIMNVSEILS
jgi:hypothetical protein